MLSKSVLRSSWFLLGFFATTLLMMSCAGLTVIRTDPEAAQASEVINRSNHILVVAQQAVHNRRVYTGDLAIAYAHEDYARDLFQKNQFHNAIEHSLYARRLAYQTLQSNGVRYRRAVYVDEYHFISRGDQSLNEEVRMMRPNAPTDDRAVVALNVNFKN